MIDSKLTRVIFTRIALFTTFICLLWVVQAINWLTRYILNPSLGLIPRQIAGLDGIIGMPLLHGSFAHLGSNTPPLIVMGMLMMTTATRGLIAVNLVIVVLGGALVWLFGSTALHVGASGLIFGWFGFLISRGFIDRSPLTLGAALLVGLVYGTMIWGVVPGQPGVSWEAHLFGAIAGTAAAVLVPTHVHAPRLSNVEKR